MKWKAIVTAGMSTIMAACGHASPDLSDSQKINEISILDKCVRRMGLLESGGKSSFGKKHECVANEERRLPDRTE